MAKTTHFVRVKPFNRKRGYLVRNYMHRGVRFTTRWKEVSEATVEELRAVCQPHDPEEQIPLFDIKTKDEALAIEAEERDALPAKMVARVKDAERVPDSKFRDDRPKVNTVTGKIDDAPLEPAEAVLAEDDQDVEPAPSVRGRGRPRKQP